MHRGAVGLLLGVALAGSTQAQPADTLSDFHRLDLQAQVFMNYLRCSANTFNAQNAGVVPPADSGTHILCASIKGRMIAAMVKTDSSWNRAISFVALDPNRKVRISEPVDTAEVLVLLRAQRFADWLTWKDSTAGPRGLSIVYRADTVIHVWVVPETMVSPTKLSVGGLRHFVLSADARKQHSADPVPPMRPVSWVNGEWLFTSIGDPIPNFAEILLAHILAEDRMAVTIELPKHYLKLITKPGMGAWVWLPKKLD
jgi:hypothetical protein